MALLTGEGFNMYCELRMLVVYNKESDLGIIIKNLVLYLVAFYRGCYLMMGFPFNPAVRST